MNGSESTQAASTRRFGIGIGAAALVILLGACSTTSGDGGPGGDESPLTVVATTTILGDLARNILGDDGSVEVLIPIGVDPHDYQASARQIATLQKADLVIANGLLLEEGLTDVLDGAAADGANVVELAPLLDPIPFATSDDGQEADGVAAGSADPHVWMDPLRMATAGHLVADQLTAIDGSIDWSARADAYDDELVAADVEIDQVLAAIPPDHRKLVTNHDSLGYLADRYGFEIVGVVIPGGSTLASPSSAELADLVSEIEREGVPAIFGETNSSPALAEAVAAETAGRVAVVELYSGSLGEPGSGAESLIGLLKTNAARIRSALS